MKFYSHILSFLLITCFCTTGFSQKDVHCGTDILTQRFYQANPNAYEQLKQTREQVRNYMQQHSVSRSDSADTIITVPVVVHIIHSGQPVGTGPNIADSVVTSQIAVLNYCFNNAKQNIDTGLVPCWYRHLIANVGVRFCLAMYDTLGDSTTGITRDSFPLPNPNFEQNVKPLTQWDPSKYLNIWVTDLNGSANFAGDVLGYAYVPGSWQYPYEDGIVIDYQYFGARPANQYVNSDTLGKTTVHEVGHWLGLYHPFGHTDIHGNYEDGCFGGTPESCDTAGDYICDTPPEYTASSGDPNDVQLSCGDSTYYLCYCADTVYKYAYDMWMDYMDYTNDDGLLMFTPEQAAEMRGVLNTVRLSIQYSTAAGSCGDTVAVIDTMSVSTVSLSAGLNLSVYPNPSTGMITLTYSLTEKGVATIFNPLVQTLFSREMAEVGQNARMDFNLGAYPNGLYFIKVQTQHSQKTLKFTLLR